MPASLGRVWQFQARHARRAGTARRPGQLDTVGIMTTPTEPSLDLGELTVRLRPAAEPDVELFQRMAVEPGLIGLDWGGFRDAGAPARRFATDGYLGPDDGRLMIDVGADQGAAGFVGWTRGVYAGQAGYWE